MRARVLVFETEGHLRKNRPANTDTRVNVFWLCPGNMVTLGSLNAVGLDDNYPSQAASISFPVGKGVKDKVKGLMPAGLIRSLAGTLPVMAQFGINAPLGHKQRGNEKESPCCGHRLLLGKCADQHPITEFVGSFLPVNQDLKPEHLQIVGVPEAPVNL
jgi:hypothetical protein